MRKKVITISRQSGSGGHSIGKSVAEQLGIVCILCMNVTAA